MLDTESKPASASNDVGFERRTGGADMETAQGGGMEQARLDDGGDSA